MFRACPQSSIVSTIPEQNIVNTLGMMFCMYRILYAISVHNKHRSGQNKNNVFVPCSLQKTKHIVAKDVVGLLLGEIVSTKNTHIVANDVVGLPVGDSKNDSLTKMKSY